MAVQSDNTDSTFFQDGTFKGSWNPVAPANTLPDGAAEDDIYLVSHSAFYYDTPLFKNQLVRVPGAGEPLRVFERFLPIEFMSSIVTQITGDTPTAGFGGAWDASYTTDLAPATFNRLVGCTVANNQITPVAPLPNLSGGDKYLIAESAPLDTRSDLGYSPGIQFTWPNKLTAGFKEFHVYLAATGGANLPFSTPATFYQLVVTTGGAMFRKRQNNGSVTNLVFTAPAAGTPVGLVLDTGNGNLSLINLSNIEAPSLIAQVNLPSVLPTRMKLAVMYVATTASPSLAHLDVKLAPDEDDLQIAPFARITREGVELPEDVADNKTYLVSAVNEGSTVLGKPLKLGDFVTFCNNLSTLEVNRLYTEADITVLVNAALNAEAVANAGYAPFNNPTYQRDVVNPADSATILTLDESYDEGGFNGTLYHDVDIVISDTTDRTALTIQTDDLTTASPNRPIRIHLVTDAAIAAFTVNNPSGNPVYTTAIAANTELVLMFCNRATGFRLLSKSEL